MRSNKNVLFAMGILLFLGCGEENPRETCIDPERIRTGSCTFDLRPVCGCDGKSYPNACAADLSGLLSWTEGACN